MGSWCASLSKVALGQRLGAKIKEARSEQSATSESAQRTSRRLLFDNNKRVGRGQVGAARQSETGRLSELSSDEYPPFVGLAALPQKHARM